MKYTNGASKIMPFPDGKSVFQITLVHYPCTIEQKHAEIDDDEILFEEKKYCTLIAIGCSHALCDGEALFELLRCWASEMRDQSYEIPEFNRRLLFVRPENLQPMDENSICLGKGFKNSFSDHGWFVSSLWPARRWQPYTWIWTKEQLNGLKKYVMSHGRASQKLKEMYVCLFIYRFLNI